MNDNEPLAVGDRVQRRDQPWMRGTVWDIFQDTVIVEWDDEPDENACFHQPRRWLQKIIPAGQPARVASRAHLQLV